MVALEIPEVVARQTQLRDKPLKTTDDGAYPDASTRREYHAARYRARREELREAAKLRKRDRKAEGCRHTATEAELPDADRVPDIRPVIERDRRDTLEGIRIRLIWASSAGGDEGTVAKAAVAVIRFCESHGVRWTDRALRTLHRRICLAEGLTPERFDHARHAIQRELFIPL